MPKTQSLWIPGPFPEMQKLLLEGRRIKVKSTFHGIYSEVIGPQDRQRWIDVMCRLIIDAKLKSVKSASFVFQWWAQNKRSHPVNMSSFKVLVIHCLVLCGVIKNGGWECVQGWEESFSISPVAPGLRITIRAEKLKP